MNDNHAKLEIMQHFPNGIRYTTLRVSEEEWKAVSYVDYIEVDAYCQLLPIFEETYSKPVKQAMLALVARA